MKKRIFMMAAIIAASHVYAQQDSTKVLDDVVVTATKFPLKQSLTGKVVTVIDRAELEKNSGKTLSELLNTQTGLTVNGSSNVLGTNQDVYLRGASAGKTLILIDGIPVYDVSGISGAFDLNLIPIEQVERVELLKGSQSTLYGSDAVAGVINIITRKAATKKVAVTANLSAGSYETYRGSASVSGAAGKLGYFAGYSKAVSKGFSSAHDETGNGNFDKDGFDEDVFRANIQCKVSPNFSVRLNGQYSKYDTDADADRFLDDIDYRIVTKNSLAGIGADYKLGKSMLHFNYSYNQAQREYLNDSVPPVGFEYYSRGNYKGRSHFAELYSNLYITKNIDLLVGADYRQQVTDQEYSSVSMFGPYMTALGDSAKVKQLGTYASLVVKGLSGFNLELGGRYNHFNKYGSVFTFSFNPSYVFAKRWKVFTNIASGFKAPSIYQVYSEYRNPLTELDPEKSFSFEGGLQYFKENVSVRAVYFIRNIKENIVFYTSPSFQSYYVNADEQKDKGFEIDATIQVGKVRLTANYTNLDGHIETKDNGKDSSYFNLYRRPKQSINLNAGIDICSSWNLNLGVQSVGKRKEDVFAGALIEMPAYYTWNLYSTYTFTKNLKVYVDLKNITDEQYYEIRGYNSKRFNFMAGAILNF